MKTLLTMAMAVTLLSCGARRTDTTKTDIQQDTDLTTLETGDSTIHTDLQQNIVRDLESVVLIPVDPAKPIVVELPSGVVTKYYNAEVGHTKDKTTTSTNSETTAAAKTTKEQKEKTATKANVKTKVTERDGSKFWSIMITVIPLALAAIALFLILNKKKDEKGEAAKGGQA